MEDDELPRYEVLLSPNAEKALRAVASKSDLRAIDNILQVLDAVPGIGRVYDPLYDAARPSEPVMVAYAGHFGIYYDVDEEQLQVQVVYIEDQRRDPLGRFA